MVEITLHTSNGRRRSYTPCKQYTGRQAMREAKKNHETNQLLNQEHFQRPTTHKTKRHQPNTVATIFKYLVVVQISVKHQRSQVQFPDASLHFFPLKPFHYYRCYTICKRDVTQLNISMPKTSKLTDIDQTTIIPIYRSLYNALQESNIKNVNSILLSYFQRYKYCMVWIKDSRQN